MISQICLSRVDPRGKHHKLKCQLKVMAGVPAQRVLRFLLTHTGTGEDSHYIDLAQCLSGVNRRLYRQGKVYGVLGCTVHDTTSDCFVKVGTVPNTWVARNAWKKAFALWKRMRREALSAAGVRSNARATWADFKVYINYDHISDVDKGIPCDTGDGSGTSLMSTANSEWVYSSMHSPDGTTGEDEFLLHMLGANVGSAGSRTSCGVIEGYQNSRARVQPDDPSIDPSDFEDGWMMNLFDDGTQHDEVLGDLTSDGDAPPYDHDDMPGSGGQMVDALVSGITHVSAAGPIGYIGPIVAPCGLLKVETKSGTDGNIIELVIELAPGGYKGVDAVAI